METYIDIDYIYKFRKIYVHGNTNTHSRNEYTLDSGIHFRCIYTHWSYIYK